MPSYDYYCEKNGQTVEVIHRLSETITTWGELCEMAGIGPGPTPVDTAVTRHITGGSFNNIKEKIKLTSILPK